MCRGQKRDRLWYVRKCGCDRSTEQPSTYGAYAPRMHKASGRIRHADVRTCAVCAACAHRMGSLVDVVVEVPRGCAGGCARRADGCAECAGGCAECVDGCAECAGGCAECADGCAKCAGGCAECVDGCAECAGGCAKCADGCAECAGGCAECAGGCAKCADGCAECRWMCVVCGWMCELCGRMCQVYGRMCEVWMDVPGSCRARRLVVKALYEGRGISQPQDAGSEWQVVIAGGERQVVVAGGGYSGGRFGTPLAAQGRFLGGPTVYRPAADRDFVSSVHVPGAVTQQA
eukprot:352737-Chlamydomonas_euryale.AAC.6